MTENYDGVKNYDNVSGGGHGREYYGSDGWNYDGDVKNCDVVEVIRQLWWWWCR